MEYTLINELVDSSVRLGKFEILFTIIKESPEYCKKIMAECVILETSVSLKNSSLVYIATSDWFDKILITDEIPYYNIFGTNLKVNEFEYRTIIRFEKGLRDWTK